jgi:hypothetical protein
MKFMLIIAALIVSSACYADTWQWMGQPGASAEKFGSNERAVEQVEMDIRFCEYDVKKTMATSQQRGGYYAPYVGTGFRALGDAMLSANQYDGLYYSCMASRGWYLAE